MRSYELPSAISVIQLGPLDRVEAENAIEIANTTQNVVHFDFLPQRVRLRKDIYLLPNRGFDLDAAAEELARAHGLPRPIIVLTSAPYGTYEHREKPKHFFFGDACLGFDEDVSVVSTFLWDKHRPSNGIQAYLLYWLATILFERMANLNFHREPHGCPFDYCDDPRELDRLFAVGRLCAGCESLLQSSIRKHSARVQDVAAARRLLHRALGRRMAFIAMPFKKKLEVVHLAATRALSEHGWRVVRADELARPRRITDAILEAILSCDLFVADLTDSNPNVYYELGLAHAYACDSILLTQHKNAPIDITTERRIPYRSTKAGLVRMAKELQNQAGSGSWGE